MFNQIRKFKFYDARLPRITSSFPSVADLFFVQFNHLSSSAANGTGSSTKGPNSVSFSAAYLENEFGFSPERALICSKRLKFDSPEKPLSVIAFLKNQEFTNSDISRFVKKWPAALGRSPESHLPKIEFFRGLGLSTSEIVKILRLRPDLLDRSLERHLIPCVDFLRSFLASDRDVVFSILRYPGIIREDWHKIILPNVEILRGVGVPKSNIAYLLKNGPRRLALDPERFRVTVQDVLDLGINPTKRDFIFGLMVMRALTSLSWKEKVKHYTRWGWSEQQVLAAIKKRPMIMSTSKDKITKIMDFVVKEMGRDVSFFMTWPNILQLSFEKRVAPRCAFYKVLLSKGLVKDSSLGTMLHCPQSLFFKKYVQCLGEKDPELFKTYEEIFSKLKA